MTTPYPLPQDVAEALSRGEKIEGIKLLREKTGLGLKEAKDLVEWHAARAIQTAASSAPSDSPWTASPGIPPGVREALAAGNKIEAIRLYREHTGAGLKAAKDAIDLLGLEGLAGRPQAQGAPSFPSAEVPPSRAGLWLALMAILIVAVGVFLLLR